MTKHLKVYEALYYAALQLLVDHDCVWHFNKGPAVCPKESTDSYLTCVDCWEQCLKEIASGGAC